MQGMRTLVLSWLAVFALSLWACGGDVVVDHRPDSGSGGSGAGDPGSSTGAPPTTSGPQPNGTGPGPGCDCAEVCATANACGFVLDDCQGWCGGLEGFERDCICDKPACELAGCFTGPLPSKCQECVVNVGEFDCAQALEACDSDPACQALVGCHLECGLIAPCVSACDAAQPGAVPQAYAFLQCSTCDSCREQCQGETTDWYCR